MANSAAAIERIIEAPDCRENGGTCILHDLEAERSQSPRPDDGGIAGSAERDGSSFPADHRSRAGHGGMLRWRFLAGFGDQLAGLVIADEWQHDVIGDVRHDRQSL